MFFMLIDAPSSFMTSIPSMTLYPLLKELFCSRISSPRPSNRSIPRGLVQQSSMLEPTMRICITKIHLFLSHNEESVSAFGGPAY